MRVPPSQGPPLTSKWVTFSASCILMVCSGLAYFYSVYAPAIKERLGLTQVQIASAGSAVNFGGYLAIISGSVYDTMKDDHVRGPRVVVWLGCLCCFCGYLGLYLLASGRAPGGFTELVLFAICAGNAGTWFDTVGLVTNVVNFPNSRGFAVGILKSFAGLSASIFTTVYMAVLAPDAVSFLLVLALAPTLLCFALSFFVNRVDFVEACELPHADNPEALTSERRFQLVYFLVAAIAAYQLASALLISHYGLSPRGRAAVAAGCLSLLCLVAAIPSNTGGARAVFARENAAPQQAAAAEEEGAGDGKGRRAPSPARGASG